MPTLKVYDPAMCCSTGVCGTTVDPRLVTLAADLAWLKAQNVDVQRYNLGLQPDAFADDPLVVSEMGEEAENLPLFVIDGDIKAKAIYPSRQDLANWFQLELPKPDSSRRVELKVVNADRCC